MSKLSRAVKLILFIWLIALLCAIPQALQFGIVHFANGPDDVMCQFKKVIVEHSFELSTFLFFIVPMTLIMVLYILIGLKLKKSTLIKRNCKQQHRRSESTRVKVGSSRMDRHCRHSRSTRRVLKMLVAVVVAFFICWAPFHMQRLIFIYGKSEFPADRNKWIEMLYAIFTYVSGVFYYISTTINPILYNIMSNKFREAFMETLARSCRMSRFVAPRERRSYSSLSRSQQRNPGTYPSRTTGMSGGTGIAQESTDCSGNSFRDEFHQERAAAATAVDLSSSETPPTLLYSGSSKQSSKKSIITVEISANDGNFSMMPGKCTPVTTNFGEMTRQQTRNQFGGSRNKELPSPRYDRCIKMQSSSGRSLHQGNIVSCRNKVTTSTSSKKKLWRLLDWLPGLKSIRTSRALTRPTQENIIVDLDQRLTKQQDDYFMQLQTFKTKDESCRPV